MKSSSHKKGVLLRENRQTSKERLLQTNRRSTTKERVKKEVYGNSKFNDVLILRILEKKLTGYGVQD